MSRDLSLKNAVTHTHLNIKLIPLLYIIDKTMVQSGFKPKLLPQHSDNMLALECFATYATHPLIKQKRFCIVSDVGQIKTFFGHRY